MTLTPMVTEFGKYRALVAYEVCHITHGDATYNMVARDKYLTMEDAFIRDRDPREVAYDLCEDAGWLD